MDQNKLRTIVRDESGAYVCHNMFGAIGLPSFGFFLSMCFGRTYETGSNCLGKTILNLETVCFILA